MSQLEPASHLDQVDPQTCQILRLISSFRETTSVDEVSISTLPSRQELILRCADHRTDQSGRSYKLLRVFDGSNSVQAKVENRLSTTSSIPDLMGKLIGEHKSGQMTMNQLKSNASFLIGAGSETLVTVLARECGRSYVNARQADMTVMRRRLFSSTEESSDVEATHR